MRFYHCNSTEKNKRYYQFMILRRIYPAILLLSLASFILKSCWVFLTIPIRQLAFDVANSFMKDIPVIGIDHLRTLC